MSDHGENGKSGNTTISLTLWDYKRLRLNRREAYVRHLAILWWRSRRERTWWERVRYANMKKLPSPTMVEIGKVAKRTAITLKQHPPQWRTHNADPGTHGKHTYRLAIRRRISLRRQPGTKTEGSIKLILAWKMVVACGEDRNEIMGWHSN